MNILAIDPGPVESAFVNWDGREISGMGKVENLRVFPEIYGLVEDGGILVVEKICSYGMAVGESVFETVFWSGRFCGFADDADIKWTRIPRMDVKMHLCHTPRAKDSNIIQALVDRFATNEKNKGKGTKASPGFFFGFRSDIWQAFALAVTYFDKSA